MATYERLDYGSPDGSQWGGASTDLLALHGSTPVDQAAAILTALTTGVTITAGVAAGFASTAQLQLMVDALNAVIVALREKGIIAT